MSHSVVIGCGTWGAAMAVLLARHGAEHVGLWGRSADDPCAIDRSRHHPHLPGITLPPAIHVSDDPALLADADLLLWAIPTPFSAAMASELAPHLPPAIPVVSLAKGIEQDSLRTVTAILADGLGPRPYGCLSGPTHAEEVVGGLPTGAVVAGPEALRTMVIERLHGPTLRVYASDDLVGVELCGAMKNVIAVAAGICIGLSLGDNAVATLITRGLAEMRRLGRAMGARDTTFAGLAGIGDLMTTCYSGFGRNRALGLAVAQGISATDHMATTGQVAEGAWTCRAAMSLSERYGIDLPIATQVASVLWHDIPVDVAMRELLARTAKEEDL